LVAACAAGLWAGFTASCAIPGRATAHLMASGLIGEPVAPVMTSGGAQKKN
jgi:hypothetical protein